MRQRLSTAALLLCLAAPAVALDLAALWDFDDPATSEQRFRAALASAAGDDALVLQTQIARSFGLRRDFDRARAELAAIEPRLAGAGAEARVRFALELGRTYASAMHPPESRTDDAKARARAAYETALAIAREGDLDALAIDALHMLAFVDSAPADQLRWAQAALERDADAAGRPDPYVFEELETLYRARGDEARARHYADRRQAARS